LADLLSNSKSIFGHAKEGIKEAAAFAKVYAVEKESLLAVLHEGDKTLYEEAVRVLKDYNDWYYSTKSPIA
jgi:hypothetical protein